MPNPIATAKRLFQACADKDRAAAEAVVAEQFSFTSPLDNRIDRKIYFERCWHPRYPAHSRYPAISSPISSIAGNVA